jgi:hypothetical protein
VINNTPEIYSVTAGEGGVTSYQVVISGINFTFRSILLVNGKPTPSFRPGTLDTGEFDVTPYNLNQPRRDAVNYVDCRTLIYVRHPTTTQPQTLNLQVINPDGSESGVYAYTGP